MGDLIGKSYAERPKPRIDGRIKPERLIRGYGVNRGEYPSNVGGVKLKQHRLWCDMLTRCYDEKYHVKKPTYLNTKVCERWLDYANFYEDITDMPFFGEENYQLDKDILGDSSIYSPQTCCFIPRELNALFKTSKEGDLPQGVSRIVFDTGCVYTATIQRSIASAYIGSFWTAEDAGKAYKDVERMYLKILAEKYEDKIESRVVDKLLEMSHYEN